MKRLVLMIVLFTIGKIFGHSHLFIDYKTHALVDSSGLKGFYIDWKFDEMFSAVLIEEYDLDGNGSFSKAEQASLMQSAFKKTAEADYYVSIVVDGKKIKIPRASKFSARMDSKREVVNYTFFLPVPLAITKKRTVQCYFVDETIFISYDIKAGDVTHKSKSTKFTVSQKMVTDDYLKKAVYEISPAGAQ